VHLEENIPLAPFTTLRIGGPARYFARIATEPDLLEAIHFARTHNLPIFTLGGGSNLVVPDEGFPGLILHTTIGSEIRLEDGLTRVDAGIDWNAFVLQTCQQGISGIACMAGIPGLVGGSPIQNIGAYGQEVASTIHSVRALDLKTLNFVDLPHAECGFAYRHSIFNSTQRNRYIVAQVSFRFDPGASPSLTYADLRKHFGDHATPTPLQIYEAVRKIRATKGMLIDPANPTPDSRSAGSFFKNPIVPVAALAHIAQSLAISEAEIPHWPVPTGLIKLPAAWLIERTGFPKGFEFGPAGISTRHTLALINRTGTATCADLLALRDHITTAVAARFQITLEQEPVTLTPTT
jgi:UDP-N-acetylmuramate dehydrogenase